MLPLIAQHTEKLYYFYEVSLAGGIQPASRKIGLSPASLSYSIKQLEGVVGTPLFHRHKKGLTPTVAGQTLLNFCRKFYRDLEDIDRFIQNPRHLSQRIKVGTFQSIAIYFWPLLLEALEESSQLSMSITTNRSKNIIEALFKREIDIALTVEGINHRNLIKHELYNDRYAFYTSNKISKRNLNIKDIENMPILFIPDATDENGQSIRQYLDSWNLKFKDEFELDSFEVISEFVSKGYGIGILPIRAALSYDKAIQRKNIEALPENSFGQHRFFLSYRDDLNLSQNTINIILKASKKAVMRMKKS